MDAKKSSPTPAAAGAAPAVASGYFNSVFSASPAANQRDTRQTDLYTMLNKQNPKGPSGGGIADSKSQGSPTKGRIVYKDGKQFYPNESSESPYFGLILARLCITADGTSTAAPHKSKPTNHQQIIRRTIRMAPWLPEVIGGKELHLLLVCILSGKDEMRRADYDLLTGSLYY